jgi:transcriptional regulator with XRE-family HTH domain
MGRVAMEQRYPRIDLLRTGRNIKSIMEEKGFTVRDIQKYLRLSAPQSIYHWFEGRNLPTIDNLYALSELFQVPVDALVCGTRKVRFDFCVNQSVQRLYLYYEKCLELIAPVPS